MNPKSYFMQSLLTRTSKKIMALLAGLMLFNPAVWAAGPPPPSIFSNPLTMTLIALMILLGLIIAILSSVLLGVSDLRTRQRKSGSIPMLVILFLISQTAYAQADMAVSVVPSAQEMIGGLTRDAFYIMVSVLFLELFIIIALLINIRMILNQQTEPTKKTATEKAKGTNWWDRFNRFRPITEEAELDLGHEYDGIRELNNRLPPWWLYGFYVTIVFAAVYLWRFHVSHAAPGSREEYDRSVAKAELAIQEYLDKKGEAVDENSFTWMSGGDDLSAGKGIFLKSCATCHKDHGGGDVGPNLTDDYWLHGNDANSVFKVVRYGINAMPSWQNQYSNKQIAQVVSYLKTLHGTNPPGAKGPDGPLMKEVETAQDTAGRK
jgi:cytochrome c oxidase cbb3-type subunit 3